jgi:antitoxin component YwqK of YwqJK toxin-antitoxin module
MKKIMILFGAVLIALSSTGQNVINKSAIYDGEIVAIKESTAGLYAYSSGFDVDDQGNISGKVLSFHENGNLNELGTLVKGEKHGQWLRYSEEGTKLNQANYLFGKKDGVWKVWDSNGNLRMKFQFEEGQRVGEWISYDSEGNIIEEKTY